MFISVSLCCLGCYSPLRIYPIFGYAREKCLVIGVLSTHALNILFGILSVDMLGTARKMAGTAAKMIL